MRKSLCGLLASGVLATVSVANAEVETFGNLTSLSPLAPVLGNSTVSGGTFTTSYGPPNITVATSGALSLLTDGKYLSYSNSTDQELTLTVAPAIAGTAGTVYVALAFRAPVISGTPTENDVDVLRVRDSVGNLFGLVVADGVLRMASTNGWTNTRILSNNIATLPGVNQWVVIAGKINQSTTPNQAKAKWWIIDGTTAVPTVVYDDFSGNTGATNAGVGDISIVNFGATYRFPSSPTDALVINVDNVRIEPGSTYTSDAAFISAVQAAYTGFPASVRDWSLY
jgi:hypothetical protein